jgi:hypothetical protein
LIQRENKRKRKTERENNYAGKVDTFHHERFEHLKRESAVAVNTNGPFLKPGVVKNVYFEGE